MKFQKPYVFGLIALSTILFTPHAQAEKNSADYALMGKRLWTAFECSALADLADDKKEQERLFILGYSEGKIFLRALREEKIKKEDLSNAVPSILLFLLQGPSDDFILGRIFENALENATENAFDAYTKTGADEEVKKRTAEDDFWKKNCKLIIADSLSQ